MTSRTDLVCIDTNLWIYALLDLDASLWTHIKSLLEPVNVVVAPSCIHEEFCHAIGKYFRGRRINRDEARAKTGIFLDVPIRLFDETGIHMQAMEHSLAVDGLSAYDAHFVAVAQRTGSLLWTADKQLARLSESIGVPTMLWSPQ